MRHSERQAPTLRVAHALHQLRDGRPLILTNHRACPIRGRLVAPAAVVDTTTMAFMIRRTSGFVAVAMNGARLDELCVPPMVAEPQNPGDDEFAVTVDANVGVTTGISAHDRAVTARQLASPTATPGDFIRPGHVVTLRTREGGVLARAESAEAAVDLCDLAGLPPVAVIADIVADTGEVAARYHLLQLANRDGLALVSIADVVATRHRFEQHAHRLHSARLSDGAAPVDVHTYRYDVDGSEFLVLVHGDARDGASVSVRTNSTSARCGGRALLDRVAPEQPPNIAAAEGRIVSYAEPGDEGSLLRSGRSCSHADAIAHILRDLDVGWVELEQDDRRLKKALAKCGVQVGRSLLADVAVGTNAPGNRPHSRGHSPVRVDVHTRGGSS
jgi:3,4-dihydroxy-2-butanone 4-phosphate synthase